MSRLDNLITELCPDGVEYVELGSLLKYEQPTKYLINNVNYNNSNLVPVLTAGKSFILGYTSEVNGVFKASKIDPVIIFDDFTTSSHWVDFDFKVKSSAMKMLRPYDKSANTRYLYYAMKTIKYSPYSHTRQWIDKYSKLMVPLPPLPVQNEIVRILDTFTDLTEELTEELTARKKQYEYYRDKLLTFTDDVEYKRLGEIGTIVRGNGLQKKDFTKSGVGCIHYGQIYTYYGLFAFETKSFVAPGLATKLQKVQTGDIIITVTSENVNDICKCVTWLGKKDIVIGGDAAVFRHNQNPRYVAYWLQSTSFFNQKQKIAQGTKVIHIQSKKLERVVIPLPPLPAQAKVVQILDRFYGLCNNLTHGLPAEIEARKKQYEYYRDKLLTFKQKE